MIIECSQCKHRAYCDNWLNTPADIRGIRDCPKCDCGTYQECDDRKAFSHLPLPLQAVMDTATWAKKNGGTATIKICEGFFTMRTINALVNKNLLRIVDTAENTVTVFIDD